MSGGRTRMWRPAGHPDELSQAWQSKPAFVKLIKLYRIFSFSLHFLPGHVKWDLGGHKLVIRRR